MVILSAFCFTRLWSLTQSYLNQETASWYYSGHEIYKVDSLDIWYAAYAGEGAWFIAITIWKLFRDAAINDDNDIVTKRSSRNQNLPKLLHSQSTMSIEEEDERVAGIFVRLGIRQPLVQSFFAGAAFATGLAILGLI